MKNTIFAISLLIFPYPFFVKGQSPNPDKVKTPVVLGIRGHYGFIIPHSETIKDAAYSNPWGIEADFGWHLNSEKAWQSFGTYPRIGFTLSYFDFDNPDTLGNAFSGTVYFEPFLAVRKKLHASFRFGVGISYLDKVYDAESNPYNLFYSSPISFLLQANFSVNYRINPHFNAKIAGFYNHISNGGGREPNKGINFPTLSLGLEYLLRTSPFPEKEKEDWRTIHEKRDKIAFTLYSAAKRKSSDVNGRNILAGISANYSRVIGRMSALSIGTEWLVDNHTKWKIQQEQKDISHHKGSLFLGHDLLLGRFIFFQQLGWYYYKPYQGHAALYQRYGIHFNISKSFFAGVSLKSHGDVADFLDARIGIVL